MSDFRAKPSTDIQSNPTLEFTTCRSARQLILSRCYLLGFSDLPFSLVRLSRTYSAKWLSSMLASTTLYSAVHSHAW
jgi:hypothetical protein